ncbi:MAG: hypothetical protein AAFU73_07360 [Planctomycetota bacterium]
MSGRLEGAARTSAFRSLGSDVKLALLSEIGARAVFDHIARRASDPDLAGLAAEMNREGIELVQEVQDLLRTLGVRPRRTSFRRRALARFLVHGSPILGVRRVLRVIRDAEITVSRWYAEYALFLLRLGEVELAERFEALRAAKVRRAGNLSAWVDNVARSSAPRL